MPKIGVIYEIVLAGKADIAQLRKAQKTWEARLQDVVDVDAGMMLFGVKGTVHSTELRVGNILISRMGRRDAHPFITA